MARRHVVVTPMMKVRRRSPKSPYLGWGHTQTRKVTTEATSPRLLKYRSCIAAKMSGRHFGSLKEVQEAFRAAAHECSRKA